MIRVTANFEGNDRKFYESIAVDQAELGKWEVDEQAALCNMGVMNVEKLGLLFDSWGDELDESEREQLSNMAAGEVIEIERGRGCWYEIEKL